MSYFMVFFRKVFALEVQAYKANLGVVRSLTEPHRIILNVHSQMLPGLEALLKRVFLAEAISCFLAAIVFYFF